MTRVIGNWKPPRGSQAIARLKVKAKVKRQIDELRKAIQLAPGPTAQRRATKARGIVEREKAMKDYVKRLDGGCRWPGCEMRPPINGADDISLLDACHYRAEGMGGNPSLSSFTPENLIALHREHHRDLHNDLARMRPLDEALGMRGPVEFSAQVPGEAGKFYVVGITEPPKGAE